MPRITITTIVLFLLLSGFPLYATGTLAEKVEEMTYLSTMIDYLERTITITENLDISSPSSVRNSRAELLELLKQVEETPLPSINQPVYDTIRYTFTQSLILEHKALDPNITNENEKIQLLEDSIQYLEVLTIIVENGPELTGL